jgi:hypothetical protein
MSELDGICLACGGELADDQVVQDQLCDWCAVVIEREILHEQAAELMAMIERLEEADRVAMQAWRVAFRAAIEGLAALARTLDNNPDASFVGVITTSGFTVETTGVTSDAA